MWYRTWRIRWDEEHWLPFSESCAWYPLKSFNRAIYMKEEIRQKTLCIHCREITLTDHWICNRFSYFWPNNHSTSFPLPLLIIIDFFYSVCKRVFEEGIYNDFLLQRHLNVSSCFRHKICVFYVRSTNIDIRGSHLTSRRLFWLLWPWESCIFLCFSLE